MYKAYCDYCGGELSKSYEVNYPRIQTLAPGIFFYPKFLDACKKCSSKISEFLKTISKENGNA